MQGHAEGVLHQTWAGAEGGWDRVSNCLIKKAVERLSVPRLHKDCAVGTWLQRTCWRFSHTHKAPHLFSTGFPGSGWEQQIHLQGERLHNHMATLNLATDCWCTALNVQTGPLRWYCKPDYLCSGEHMWPVLAIMLSHGVQCHTQW